MTTKSERFKVIVTVLTLTHKVAKTQLDEWNKRFGGKLYSPMLYEFIDDKSFNLIFFTQNRLKVPQIGYSLLVSLNIATIGHFWSFPSLHHANFEIFDQEKKESSTFQPNSGVQALYAKQPKVDLTFDLVKKAHIIWCALIKLDEQFFKYYIAGMTLMTSPTAIYDFHEEVFFDFYKVIERFIAVEIYKNKKTPTVEEILNHMRQLGINDSEFLEEAKKIYILRGGTVMHSVGKEKQITIDDALKCKCFADLFLNKELFRRMEEKAKHRNNI